MKGLDTNQPLNAHLIACFKQSGYQFVCRYLRNFLKDEAQAISQAGLQIVSIHEKGAPTSAGYFSFDRGQKDGYVAVRQAQAIGQPAGTAIYATVDYDAVAAHLPAIGAYFQGFNDSVKQLGSPYKVGGYGSGLVLAHLLSQGLIKFAWLCGSTGYQGYHTFTDWQIKQGAQVGMCGIEIDTDEAQGDTGAWSLTQPAPQPAPQPVPTPRTLKLTQPMMQGADVRALQLELAARGYFHAGVADGIYGRQTEQAVKNFQTAVGLQVDGIVGARTLARLKEPDAPEQSA